MKYLKIYENLQKWTAVANDTGNEEYVERISQFVLYLRQEFTKIGVEIYDKDEIPNIYSTVSGIVRVDCDVDLNKLLEILDEFTCIKSYEEEDLYHYMIQLDLQKLVSDPHWFFQGSNMGLI